MMYDSDKLSEAAQTAAMYADVREALIQYFGNEQDPSDDDVLRAVRMTLSELEPRYLLRDLKVVVAEVCADMGFDYCLSSEFRPPKKSSSWRRVDQLELRIRSLEVQVRWLSRQSRPPGAGASKATGRGSISLRPFIRG